MLHDMVVLVRINTDVALQRKAEIHNILENAMNIMHACYTMDNVVWFYIIHPFSAIYF